jgi:hypothetical protein
MNSNQANIAFHERPNRFISQSISSLHSDLLHFSNIFAVFLPCHRVRALGRHGQQKIFAKKFDALHHISQHSLA